MDADARSPHEAQSFHFVLWQMVATVSETVDAHEYDSQHRHPPQTVFSLTPRIAPDRRLLELPRFPYRSR